MGILTANINFLASLGITTSEQFMAAFGDMAAFTEYCDEIGYSWEIDENNDLILITPNGNTVNTYIEVEAKTATPTITVTPGNTAYTIEATGEGTVKLYIDDVEVFNPVSIERTTESQEITVTATAQAEGKEISDEAEEEIVIPALDTTAAPDIESIPGLDSYDIVALGDGTVKLYLGGNEVANPYTVVRTDQNQTLTFTATAQEVGKQISETTEEEFIIPALPVSDTPVITATKRDADYLISVSAGQDAVLAITCDGEAMANPFVITRGNSNTTVTIIATATEPHHSMATTSQQVLIEALPITATPTISYTQGLTAYTITATGNGTVLLYADGVVTQNPCSISRTTTSQTIVFTATAQEANHQISATATETVTIPAMEVTATPVITYDSTTFTVDVTGNGTVLSYVDGVATQMPHTFTQGQSAVTYVVTATAQEVGKQISTTATQNCVVPALKTATPTISYIENPTNVVVTASGSGTVRLYADGTQVDVDSDTASYTVNKTSSAQTIVFTATAKESGKDISDTATSTITVPASGQHDYSQDYLTVEISNTGGVSSLRFELPAGIDDNYVTSVSYSLDNGTTWVDTTNDNTDITIEISQQVKQLPNGSKVLWKGNAISFGKNTTPNQQGQLILQSSAGDIYTVSGNMMSMLYGDNFANQTSFPSGSTYTFARFFNSNNNATFDNIVLPATTLTNYCYTQMFNGCTRLTSAPVLPATTLAQNCYKEMFKGCTSLTSAPALPATTLVNSCYSNMFQNCSSLTSAPTLPATTLATLCYNQMFNGCTALTAAPALPATTLATKCYYQMFQNCSNLNSITMLAEDITANQCLVGWVDGVAATGTFTKSANMTTLPTGDSGIPSGWTVVDYGVVPNYMKLSVLNESGNDGNITITIPAAVDSTKATSMSYSKDGSNWTDTTIDNTAQTITIPVNAGDEVYLKGIANQWAPTSSFWSNSTNIDSTANINISGNIMSLLYGDNFENQTSFPANSRYNFTLLFKQNSHLIDASQLELPAMTLVDYCYTGMFNGCTSLTTAPALPATTLAPNCYGGSPAGGGLTGMFYGCTSLTTAPALPATTLAEYCYFDMFHGCTSLTTAPALPATTLATYCYGGMFYGCTSLTTAPTLSNTTLASSCYKQMFNNCTSLTTAPALPATTMIYECYQGMFQGCTSLTTAPALPATTLAEECYQGMFNNCTSLTTAPALPATTLAEYCYSCMFSGCTSLTTAPVLPATTLVKGCYGPRKYANMPIRSNEPSMFYNCTSLNSITMLAEDISAALCLANWTRNVAATGTFTKSANMTTLPTGADGIPTGWTVQDYVAS